MPQTSEDLETDIAALDLEAIGLRVRRMLAVAKLDGKDFSARIGVPYGTLRAYLSGSRPPSAEFLVACLRAFGFSPSWILLGEGPMARDSSAAEQRAGDDWGQRFVTIPFHTVQASAGPGYRVQETGRTYTVNGMCLAREWLAARRLSATNLNVISVRGSSMAPVLSNGDQVLVDVSDTHPKSGFVYVLRQGDELLVKYVQFLPGGLIRVGSANPAFPTYDINLTKEPDVQIIGRVVASMHDW